MKKRETRRRLINEYRNNHITTNSVLHCSVAYIQRWRLINEMSAKRNTIHSTAFYVLQTEHDIQYCILRTANGTRYTVLHSTYYKRNTIYSTAFYELQTEHDIQSVSYTHLDVYKRQRQQCMNLYICVFILIEF